MEVQRVITVVNLGSVFSVIFLLDVDHIPLDEIRTRLSAEGLNQFSLQCQLLHSDHDSNPYAARDLIGPAWNAADCTEGTLNRLSVLH